MDADKHSNAPKVLRIVTLALLLAGGTWIMQGPPNERDDDNLIIITDAQVAHLQARWIKQWNRTPNQLELQASVDAYVRDEILYREALRQGLDRQDPRVRLALIQKMNLLSAGRSNTDDIPQADLEAFFCASQRTLPSTSSI